jgi:hypothetical protein
MVGFVVEDHEPLYNCAAIWYTTLMWLTNKILKKKNMVQRKAYSEMVHMKPEKSYGKKELAKWIDKYVYSIQEYLKRGILNMNDEAQRNIILRDLSGKLQKCLVAIDGVLKVTE